MLSVPEHFFAHEGKCCDKWENYLSVYDTEFSRFVTRGSPIALLEIGVQDGGSLEVWQKVFPLGSSFVGIDVDPRVGALEYGAGITVKVGDASDAQVLNGLLTDATFDVIIDDGSHRSQDIIASFIALFGRLRPGGIYCIEDLACSYHRHFEVGLRHPKAAIEWLKRLVDGLHAEYWNEADVDDDVDRPFRDIFGPWVERVTFYESLAVITKRATPKTLPVRRVLTGRTVTQSDHFRIFSIDFPNNPSHHRFGAAFASELASYIARERDARPLPAPPTLAEPVDASPVGSDVVGPQVSEFPPVPALVAEPMVPEAGALQTVVQADDSPLVPQIADIELVTISNEDRPVASEEAATEPHDSIDPFIPNGMDTAHPQPIARSDH